MFYSMKGIFFIFLLIHQRVAFHGVWASSTSSSSSQSSALPSSSAILANRKQSSARASDTPTTPLPLGMRPLVSSSEATLLTTPELMSTVMRMQRRHIDFGDDINSESAEIEQNEIPSAASVEQKSTETSFSDNKVKEKPIHSSNKNNNNNKNNKGNNMKKQNGQFQPNKQKLYKIVSVRTNCTRDLFEMHLGLNRGFHGLLYAKDFPLECRARGNADNNITLRLPTSGCGVRAEPRADGSMELSVRVMLQIEHKLRQSSDILRTIRCKLPATAMGMNVLFASAANRGRYANRNSRMRLMKKPQSNRNSNSNANYFDKNQLEGNSNEEHDLNEAQPAISEYSTSTVTSINSSESATMANSYQSSSSPSSSSPATSSSSSTTPRVRIWLELGGPNGSGSVEVGVATTLTVRAIVPGTMGVRVVECAALDGLGDSTQQLLDERGCPIDEQVMPELHTQYKPAEEGWSKQNEDDLVEKTFTATFPAFKFPDRERLHVSCGVQLCKGKCPDINCRTGDKLILPTDKHLARIEVFNSLAVTAPQIEVDRLRYERYFNQSDEYSYVRTVPGEGTLCLSVSKLAISFCILGLIFLIAVIVAVLSLIRSKRRPRAIQSGYSGGGSTSRAYRTEISTSMFSSSSDSAQSGRLGSKLLIPYYPNNLPYGRVY